MPRAWGGPEVDLIDQVEILEVLSAADASAGWCAMIGSDSGFYYVRPSPMPTHGRSTPNWTPSPLVGSCRLGTLEVTDGGYRLSGRWSFGSGCTHADVMSAGAVLTEGGVPVPGPDGRPQVAGCPAASGEVEIHDTWHTTGLCGTGNNDYVSRARSSRPGIPSDRRATARGHPLPLAWPVRRQFRGRPTRCGGRRDRIGYGDPGRKGQYARQGPCPRRAEGSCRYRARPGDGRIGPQLRV